MGLNYLDSVKKQFEYYKVLGEKTFSQLNEEDFFHNTILKAIPLPLSSITCGAI